MSKTHSFSIYLLKDGFNATNALKDGHRLDDGIEGTALPEGATLYVLDTPPMPPWWKGYFGIATELTQSLKGAVIFLPVSGRTFAITFGHVYHNLHETSYEYDFGLRVTLNCLDPDKLKSTDVINPASAIQQRTQVPTDSDLTFFDFDRDTTILKSLTGKVLEKYKGLFKHATGAANIRVSSDVTAVGLPSLCETLLELYAQETYKTTFPDIQNIAPVRDPSKVEKLNIKLLEAVISKDEHLSLTVPKILDYQDGLYATFSGTRTGLVYDDIFIGQYYDHLNHSEVKLEDVTIDTLKLHNLVLTNEEGQAAREKFSIYKCLIFDTVLDGTSETYHLCDGDWYLVEQSFVTKLSNYLDPLCADTSFAAFTQKDEGEFNTETALANDALVCLDKTSIAPTGQKAVEPCDMYELKDDGTAVLHHIKISTLSAQLSHLFNQGTNSIHLLRDDDESRNRLKALVAGKVPADKVASFHTPIDSDKLKVTFGIITHKEPGGKSLNLPLFSRISLMRAMKDMKRMGIEASYCFIKDDRPHSEGKTKKRKKRKAGEADNDDSFDAEAA